jgi:hypothetical protein
VLRGLTRWSTAGRGRPALGWQPSRFLTDRAEAERALALAERLGSVNAAAQELATTWPSLRKAFAVQPPGLAIGPGSELPHSSIPATTPGRGEDAPGAMARLPLPGQR